MSDAHNEHESPIKTPKQLIIVILLSFLVPIITIVLLVNYVSSNGKTGAGSSAMTAEAVADRIAPVAKLELKDASAPKVLKTGEEVYKAVCTACHANGVAGSPKFGDATAWSERIKQGVATLFDHALKGYKGMPAKGGNADLEDIEVQRAVVYMANAGGAKFDEPAAPAAASVAAAPTADATPAATPAPNIAAALAAANATAAPAATVGADAGKKLFEGVCIGCHGAGVAGAPKFGDKTAWAPRIKQGLDTLYGHALKGFQGKAGMMPAKGGSSASDDEVKAAVRYMVDAGK